MTNQLKHFEGPFAATEAAEFAANYGGEVVHEGVLFSVTYDDARTIPAAGDPAPGGYPAPGYPAPGYPTGYPVSAEHPTSAGFPAPGQPARYPTPNTVAEAIAAARTRKA
jgi:hypothetical protein